MKTLAVVFLTVLIITLALAPLAGAEENYELEDGRWFTLYDDKHQVLLRTGIIIYVGDRFLDRDNRLYEVYQVDYQRLRAWAKEVHPGHTIQLPLPALPVQGDGLEEADLNRVALYHTHSGESYVPSDRVASTDRRRGGIYSVGAVLASVMEDNQVEVIHDQTTHFPHSGSYRRSRRTAQRLVQKGVDAIFDVHRDAAPVGAYLETIEDVQVTQVLLVIGRQNPSFRVNEQFAFQLKATADALYPDLVKGVFYGRGGYNQDLHPRALLLEMGAHTNRREHAEQGARFFAEVIAATLYGEPPVESDDDPTEDTQRNFELQPTTDPQTPRGGGLARGIATLLALVGLGGAAFMFISTGSWEGVKEKLVQFKDNEFRDLTGRIPWEKLSAQGLRRQASAYKWRVDIGGLAQRINIFLANLVQRVQEAFGQLKNMLGRRIR